MLKRREREQELLTLAAGKLERVARLRGLRWSRDGGNRREVVTQILDLEYAADDAEAERKEKRGRKRLREALGYKELLEEIRELLWDLWEEGQKGVEGAWAAAGVGKGVGGKLRARTEGEKRVAVKMARARSSGGGWGSGWGWG